jgi:hypothetical protein
MARPIKIRWRYGSHIGLKVIEVLTSMQTPSDPNKILPRHCKAERFSIFALFTIMKQLVVLANVSDL